MLHLTKCQHVFVMTSFIILISALHHTDLCIVTLSWLDCQLFHIPIHILLLRDLICHLTKTSLMKGCLSLSFVQILQCTYIMINRITLWHCSTIALMITGNIMIFHNWNLEILPGKKRTLMKKLLILLQRGTLCKEVMQPTICPLK